jgi:hypothetical protein
MVAESERRDESKRERQRGDKERKRERESTPVACNSMPL